MRGLLIVLLIPVFLALAVSAEAAPTLKSATLTGTSEVTAYFDLQNGLPGNISNAGSYEIVTIGKPLRAEIAYDNSTSAVRLMFGKPLIHGRAYNLTVVLPSGNQTAAFMAELGQETLSIGAETQAGMFLLGASLECDAISRITESPLALQAAAESARTLGLGVVKYCGGNYSATASGIGRLAAFLREINATALVQADVCDDEPKLWAGLAGHASYWEIGNEPDSGPEHWQECFGTADEQKAAKEYAKRLAAYTAALKAENSSIRIIKLPPARNAAGTLQAAEAAARAARDGAEAYVWGGLLELDRNSPLYNVMLLYSQLGGRLVNVTGNSSLTAIASSSGSGLRLILVNTGSQLINATVAVEGQGVNSAQYAQVRVYGNLSQTFTGRLTPRQNSVTVLSAPNSVTSILLGQSPPENTVAGQPRIAAPVVANGPDVTMAVQVVYLSKNLTASLAMPGWNSAGNFRVREGNVVKKVALAGERLQWAANATQKTTLYFDVPAPKLELSLIAQNSTIYQAIIAIKSENRFLNVTAVVPINSSYGNWKLYWFSGAGWEDVTSMLSLNVTGDAASFSGPSLLYQKLMVEGEREACSDKDADGYFSTAEDCPAGTDCNDYNSTTNPGAAETCGNKIDEDCSGKDLPCKPRLFGRKAAEETIQVTYRVEKLLTAEMAQPVPVVLARPEDNLSITLIAPDEVEAGKAYTAIVRLLSGKKGSHTLVFAGMSRQASLQPGVQQEFNFSLAAPVNQRQLTLSASVGSLAASKEVIVVYKPLFLYVKADKSGKVVVANITVRNYKDMLTELTIVRDSNSEVFRENIEGVKEYNGQFLINEPGKYAIVATAYSDGKIAAKDNYFIDVEPRKEGISARLILTALAGIAALAAAAVVLRKRRVI